MNKQILKNRIKAIRSVLSKQKINALVITKQANVTYTTGFLGEDSWTLISPAGVYLITDSRYTEQAQAQCPCCKIIEREGPITTDTAKLIKKQKSIKSVAVEEATSMAHFISLQKALRRQLKTASGIVEQFRITKDKTEQAHIQTAADIALKVINSARRYAKAGITENELAGKLDLHIRRLGAGTSFEAIVAFGANASQPHHKPTNKKLKSSDTILIDLGVRYKGYCSDITRCFTVGKAAALYDKAFNAVRQAHDTAIEMVKPGVEIAKVDAAVRKVIAQYNLPVYGHGTGHGIGLEVHEGPVITDKIKGTLEAGMVFTIEPAVYIPGKLGVRIEDDILVTKTGCKVLTSP